MYMKVREAMQLGGLKKCRLVAGAGGLEREILCVDNMEVPDIERWLKKGEFLVTTGYSMREDERVFLEVIEGLSRHEASGIAVKTRYIGAIPEKVVRRADQLNIPVFEIPEEIPTLEMTEPLIRAIVDGKAAVQEQSEISVRRSTDFYMDLITGNVRGEEDAEYRAHFLKWPRTPLSLVVIDIDGFKHMAAVMGENELSDLKRKLEMAFRGILARKCTTYSLVSKSDSFSCILPGFKNRESLLGLAKLLTGEAKCSLGLETTAGIVPEVPSYLELGRAHEDARDVIAVCRADPRRGKCGCISDVQLEQAILRSRENTYLKAYVEGLLGPLEAYDRENQTQLVRTLEVLVQNMGVRTQAAEELFLHRNTLFRRIQKIEELTGYDLSRTEGLLNLGIALKFRPFLK